MYRYRLIAGFLTTSLATATSVAQTTAPTQPTWSPNIIATGQAREQIRSLPIEQRPYRPLHFYGNTVRRMHHRGTPLPSVGETMALPVQILLSR